MGTILRQLEDICLRDVREGKMSEEECIMVQALTYS
jgi:hypothetical protein